MKISVIGGCGISIALLAALSSVSDSRVTAVESEQINDVFSEQLFLPAIPPQKEVTVSLREYGPIDETREGRKQEGSQHFTLLYLLLIPQRSGRFWVF